VARNDLQQTEARIAGEREETARLVMALTAELEEIIESMSLSNNDDEHDPDGATNGYERAKATAMLRHAQERLTDLEHADARLRDGSYGRCEACGAEIGAERLEALATTTRCIACAALGPGERR
jgi:DnaK suppressor protein